MCGVGGGGGVFETTCTSGSRFWKWQGSAELLFQQQQHKCFPDLWQIQARTLHAKDVFPVRIDCTVIYENAN